MVRQKNALFFRSYGTRCRTRKRSPPTKVFHTACEQFVGRHSGENIAAAFEKIVQQFEIKNKITYIITDNAANTKKV